MGNSKYLKINSCGITDCDKSWTWRCGGHGDHDLLLVLRGEGEFVLDQTPYRANAGSCFLIPKGTPIYGTQDPTNRMLVYNVHFDGDPNLREYGASEVKSITNLSFFRELFDRLIRFYNMNKRDLAELCLELLLYELFSSAARSDEAKEPLAAEAHLRLVNKMCDRINESPKANGSLSVFAAEYGYSATYLGKIFHRICGIKFSAYLSNVRINMAKSLLLGSELPVSEISDRLGYYDACHFTRQFKKSVGCTPHSYRHRAYETV